MDNTGTTLAPAPNFPGTEIFKSWLVDAMRPLGITASALGVYAGMGPNSVGRFIQEAGRDIKLGSAARVYIAIHKLAQVKGVEIPDLPRDPLQTDS